MAFKKKIVGGVVAASMLVAIVPAATALAADDQAATASAVPCGYLIWDQCHANFYDINGAALGHTAGVMHWNNKNWVAKDAPVVDGMEFVGWFDKNGTQFIPGQTPLTDTVDLYAKYQPTEVDPGMQVETHQFTVKTNGGVIGAGENAGQSGDFFITASSDEDLLDVLNALNVTRDGYTLAGWSYESDAAAAAAGTSTTVAAGDKLTSDGVTVVARWDLAEVDPGMQVETHQFTVKTNGGVIGAGENAGQSGDVFATASSDEDLLDVLNALNVTRDGYTLAGWSYTEGGTNTKVAAGDKLTSDGVTVEARWDLAEVDPGMQVKQFNVNVYLQGGQIEGADEQGDQTLTVGQNEKLGDILPTPTRSGYVFDGWTYDEAGKSAVVDTDFVSANIAVYAQWKQLFTVVYNTNGGVINGESGDFQITVAKGDTLLDKLPTADEMTREGFTFKGWNYAETGTKKDGKAVKKGDKVKGLIYKVVARWDADDVDPGMQVTQYNVVAGLNGGNVDGVTGDLSIAVAEGDTLLDKLPTPVREGYTFKGWNYAETGTDKDGKAVKADDVVTGDLYKVVARWDSDDVDPGMQVKQFNVILHTNGGTVQEGEAEGQMGDVMITVGQNEVLGGVLPKVTRLDYVFAGWTYDADGKSPVLNSDFISANTELFAQWKPAEVDPGMQVKTFNLTMHTQGGTIQEGDAAGQAGDVMTTVGQNETLSSVLPKVTRQDYVFAGWTYDAEGKSTILSTDFISADTEVYAQWEPAEVDPGMQVKTFTLIAHTQGGTIQDGEFAGQAGDVQYEVGQNETVVSALPKVTRQDYVLTGWTYDAEGKSAILSTDFISANTEVYAQWEPAEVDPGMQVKTFTLIAHTQGGTIQDGEFAGQMGDVQYEVGQNETVVSALPKVTREGYVLTGWTYDADGKSAIVSTDFISANTEVYAQWTKAKDDTKKDDTKSDETKTDTKDEKKAAKKAAKKLSSTGAAVASVAVMAAIALIGGGVALTMRKRA